MTKITLCVPYYRNPMMLRKQAEAWAGYPPEIRVIVVDDGSPVDPAHDVLPADCRAALYRIETDIPWNRNGARNLAMTAAETVWALQIDIDHILLPKEAAKLVARELDRSRWYKFRRYRVGRADETRRKDLLPPEATFGEIKPHIDSHLMTRALFWSVGGYDEDYSGSIGGSAPFLAKIAAAAALQVFPDIALRVHTRHSVPDAGDRTLSRDEQRYRRIRAEKKAQGDPMPTTHLRFPWHRAR